jgi:hypothetical protein
LLQYMLLKGRNHEIASPLYLQFVKTLDCRDAHHVMQRSQGDAGSIGNRP